MPSNVTVNIGGKDVANTVRKHLVRDPICKLRGDNMRIQYSGQSPVTRHASRMRGGRLGYVTMLQGDFIESLVLIVTDRFLHSGQHSSTHTP